MPAWWWIAVVISWGLMISSPVLLDLEYRRENVESWLITMAWINLVVGELLAYFTVFMFFVIIQWHAF